MTASQFDIAVIGAGSGGLTVAAAAAQFGQRVVLFEKGDMGGDCLNTGCVPSKALLAAAKQAHAMRSGEMVRIDVTDHGPGIPEKCRERVFERFYRVDKGRSRLLGGTGLGLSIVRHAIERNGGRVWVESPEHEGSRFVVLLPAVHPSAPCAP